MSEVTVRGGATPEELAALTAVLSARSSRRPAEDDYARWRRTRLTALRASDDVARGQVPR